MFKLLNFRALNFAFLISFILIGCTLNKSVNRSEVVNKSTINEDQAFQNRWHVAILKTQGRLFKIDPDSSIVRIYAYRAGQAAKLGHNHVLSAPLFEGYFLSSNKAQSESSFELKFKWTDFEIDNQAYRENLGPAFQTVLSKAAIDGTREHMLGEDNFQADLFPYVFVRSVQISGEAPKFVCVVEVEIHGTKKQIIVPLSVDLQSKQIVVKGNFAIRQTDFGVKPYSVLGGLLSVKDEVSIEFELKGSYIESLDK